jgi:hypothetical protein
MTDGFHRITRETGLVEIVCPHGVGHPSQALTPTQAWREWMAIHSCCGCCWTGAWHVAELRAVEAEDASVRRRIGDAQGD